ncbi:hypothetical protein [Mycobacterium sp.]|uniref:hypothetical protein n=1 Tax=Mycobacterium sp. TaxID=1785 RepID=UPI0031DCB7C5
MTGPAAAVETGWVALDGAHWLHPQRSSRIPRRYVFLDTEAVIERGDGGEIQRWRCGATAVVRWKDKARTWTDPVIDDHDTPEQLWAAVCDQARRDLRVVVAAHNLAYDLRIARGLEILPAAGWQVHRPTVVGDHVSLELRRDGQVIVLVDTVSVFPTPLARIADLLGVPRPDLPDDDAGPDEWTARCRADVQILAAAYMSLIRRLDDGDLGGWARSGAGIGWHHLLRRHLTDQVLVHRIPAVVDAEVAGMYSGRAEVWRWGPQTAGPYVEWDYRMAYAHVAATTPLPAVYLGEVVGVGMGTLRRPPTTSRWLVRATVTQTVPVLPVADQVGVCWPVGEISGWWWEVELAAAEAAGARIVVHHAHRYRAALWLEGFARACIDAQDCGTDPDSRLWALVTKHWARAVPGRTAMRYSDWREEGDAWVSGVSWMPMVDVDSGGRGRALMLGGRRWEAWEERWADSSVPQALSAIMASSRVRLWDAMVTAGFDHLVYVDTDCVIVDPAGDQAVAAAVAGGRLPGLVRKSTHDTFEAWAPQLVEGSTYRRLAGIPRGARPVGDGTYVAEVWDGLSTTLGGGHADRVAVRELIFSPLRHDTRRVHLPGGATGHVRVDVGGRVVDDQAVAG